MNLYVSIISGMHRVCFYRTTNFVFNVLHVYIAITSIFILHLSNINQATTCKKPVESVSCC